LCREWVIQEVQASGIDSTSEYNSKIGGYIRFDDYNGFAIFGNGSYFSENSILSLYGRYSLEKSKTRIVMYLENDNTLPVIRPIGSSLWKIERLTKKDLIITTFNNEYRIVMKSR
jgi:hypothetical protein